MANSNGNVKNLRPWNKGQSGNPKGRPPIICHNLQKKIDESRNEFKARVLEMLWMKEADIEKLETDFNLNLLDRLLISVIRGISMHGDVSRLRVLLEFVFGKIPEDPLEFEINGDERTLVVAYRRRLETLGQAGSEDTEETMANPFSRSVV